jgi:cell division protein FtsB
MTARRGSFRYKIVRLARARNASGAPSRLRAARVAAAIAGRGLVALVALFVSATIAAQVYHVAVRNIALRQQIQQVDDDNARLAAENEKLAARVVHLQDPEYLVPLIHEQLGLTKPNEVFIEVAPSTPAPTDAQ